jgi:hypothetical protein
MAIWRMSMRVGSQGVPMWRECLEREVAAITYEPLARIDLSKLPAGEPKEKWDKLQPTQKASLWRVAYEMKQGDTIYVKDGLKIIHKGRVTGDYFFDSKFRIVDPNGVPWSHQVPVEWAKDFTETEVRLGAEQFTVLKLSPERVTLLERAVNHVAQEIKELEAVEGELFKGEAVFRSRNRALIRAKKANCDYRCEVCGFHFEEMYGEIGRGYILAHHLRLVAQGPSKTTLNDIALVCANCHAMIHTRKSPMGVEELRELVEARRRA